MDPYHSMKNRTDVRGGSCHVFCIRPLPRPMDLRAPHGLRHARLPPGDVLRPGAVSARISLCGLGQFALFAGDTPLNDGALEPGWTDYRTRCLYSVYDLLPHLVPGENRITVLIGNGMYHVDGERYAKFRASYGPPTLIAAVEIAYADGTEEVTVTDGSWSFCTGPVTHSCIYGGEDYDARLSAWRLPMAACPGAWQPADVWDGPGGILAEAVQPPVAIRARIAPVSLKPLGPGRVLADFGRNFAGRVSFRVRGEAGQTVKVIPGELLGEDGVNQHWSGDPHYYVYTLAGGGEEEYRPLFTYYGLRYAVLETEAELLCVEGVENCAACPETGSFSCSNPLFNRIHQLIVGAIRSNMQSVFTDCPHREKLGWTEQLHLIGPGILYDFDAAGLMAKVLQDMADAQTEEGLVPDIAPEFVEFEYGFRDSPEWGSSCVILPWYLYRRSGDRELLARSYDTARRYVDYLLGMSRDYILNHGLGDWLDVGNHGAHPAHTPIPVTASAMLVMDLKIMEKTARALGRYGDVQRYREEALRARNAFNEAFYYPMPGQYGTGSQTCNAMALYLDMPDDGARPRVLANLIRDIERRGDHLTGGDVGHPFILRALSACGRDDVIARVLSRTDFPSYGYMVEKGATTLCEAWDGCDPAHPDGSQNHFMLGGAEEWFYGSLAGARIDMDDVCPLTIAPCFPEEVDWVECCVAVGGASVPFRWEKDGRSVTVTVTPPRGMGVRVVLPSATHIIEPDGTDGTAVTLRDSL